MMRPANQQDSEARVAGRLRRLRIIWFALLVTIGMYYFITRFTGQPESNPIRTLSLALAAAGAFFVLVSLLFKQKYLKQAVETQRIELVITGYILAYALCEVPALLGLVDYFVTGNRYYYV